MTAPTFCAPHSPCGNRRPHSRMTSLQHPSAAQTALPRSFYERDTVQVAHDLVGRMLVHRSAEGETAGIIVETEAYGPEDPANHAFRGKTPRNAHMFGPAGRAYVYLSYGVNWCFNAVTGGEGVGEAVLIRALEPMEGIALMRSRRGTDDVRLLCSGPGRLCKAMGISIHQNGLDLTTSELTIGGEADLAIRPVPSTRIGISTAADRLWRFCAAGSRFLSRPDGTRRALSQSDSRSS